MSITQTVIGQMDGNEINEYILDNGKGLRANILNYGGIIKNLFVTDNKGKEIDVVLGRDSFEEYLDNFGYYGAAIGRHANRIENSEFKLNGQSYKVGSNENGNSLHGGYVGFDKRVWESAPIETDGEPSLVMTLVSGDLEEGFPGELHVTMTYTLTSDNALKITYSAIGDKDTIVNLTNHSYFNLAGHDSGTIENQVLQMNAAFYTPNSSACMPTGIVESVQGTPFDFRVPKPIGQDINADFEQIEMFGGYDHNFALSGRGYRLGAVASCLENGITMQMHTDAPAVQLYTTNGVEEGRVCKGGIVYQKHQAFCLETQVFPNAMRYSHFPSPILSAGDEYTHTTEYKFIVK